MTDYDRITSNPHFDMLMSAHDTTQSAQNTQGALVPMVVEQSARGERSFDIFHVYCVSALSFDGSSRRSYGQPYCGAAAILKPKTQIRTFIYISIRQAVL